jgi:hypothetical protein
VIRSAFVSSIPYASLKNWASLHTVDVWTDR